MDYIISGDSIRLKSQCKVLAVLCMVRVHTTGRFREICVSPEAGSLPTGLQPSARRLSAGGDVWGQQMDASDGVTFAVGHEYTVTLY